jgi:hypothetical protein
MPSHMWGDPWFKEHGNKLNEAISYCMDTWLRYGRIGSHGKEKYGTFRDHPYFWNGGIHGLIWPGYYSIRNRFLYFKLDRYIIKPLFYHTGITYLGNKWQAMVYNYAVQKMCKKYPEITDELVADLDGYELVRPGIFGPVCGTTIHKKYWKTYND